MRETSLVPYDPQITFTRLGVRLIMQDPAFELQPDPNRLDELRRRANRRRSASLPPIPLPFMGTEINTTSIFETSNSTGVDDTDPMPLTLPRSQAIQQSRLENVASNLSGFISQRGSSVALEFEGRFTLTGPMQRSLKASRRRGSRPRSRLVFPRRRSRH